jgi:putative transposase
MRRRLLKLFFSSLLRMLYSRRDLFLENLALRQQLAVLHSRHPRPRFRVQDKLFWVVAFRWWGDWKRVMVVVTPETVVRWHRAGFRLYWSWLSRHPVRTGRKRISGEVRELIFRMLAENPSWGAPRIHGELQMLGFDLSNAPFPGGYNGRREARSRRNDG